jgi:DNA-binding transcriptional MerR regulator
MVDIQAGVERRTGHMALTIGALSRQAGVSVQTIRYYEREGLMEAPDRNVSGYRSYEDRAVERLQFIHRAQALGFTLRQIRELIALQHDREADCGVVRATASEKLRAIEDKIASLTRMKIELDHIIATCGGHGPIAECRIMECLAAPEGAGVRGD